MALGGETLQERSPVPMLLETGLQVGLPSLLVETPKRVRETGERTGHLSVPRGLPLFPVLSLILGGFMSWPVSPFTENCSPLWKSNFKNGFYLIFYFYFVPPGLFYLQGMGWFLYSVCLRLGRQVAVMGCAFVREPVTLESVRS